MRKAKLNKSPIENRILLIDDEIGIINSVSVVLKRNGYFCEGVTDPLEGIKLLKEQHFDILILDYLMENIHGDEVIKMIREFNKDLYIILLTGHKDIAPPLLTIKAFDIQAYCEKSDKFDQLILMVESARKSVLQMKTIKQFNESLNIIIASMTNLYQIKSLEDIISEIVREISKIIECENCFILLYENKGLKILNRDIYKGIGKFNKNIEQFMAQDYPEIKNNLHDVRSKHNIVKLDKAIILPLVNEYFNLRGVLYLQGEGFNEFEKILEMFLGHVNAALNNSIMHMLVNSKNEELSKAYDEIDKLFKILEENYRRQIDKNEFLEHVVKSRTASIKNLLDNARQGFLTFGNDLLIDSEYSLECTNLLGNEIENKRLSLLLFSGEEENIQLMDNAFVNILEEKDWVKREAYISLLPDEIELRGRYINLEYKIISSNVNENIKKIMVILTDCTEKRQLETERENEKRILKMVVKVVTNYIDFFDCLDEYTMFCENNASDILNFNKPVKYIVLELYREIHTYKGSFSNFQLSNTVSSLQSLEDRIIEFKNNLQKLSIADLQSLINSHDLKSSLETDIETLKEILSEEFFKFRSNVCIQKEKLIEIENKMESMLEKQECQILIPLIRNLRLRPFGELLRTYPEYVINICERIGKKVHPFEVVYDDQILIDADNYGDFARSLIHIFRNIAGHAIEHPEDRLAAGKDEFGNVACKIKNEGNLMLVIISDDGRGIDIDEIRNCAIKTGIYSKENIDKLNDKEILNLIFSDEITTAQSIDEISGRGIGLSVTKKEVDKLHGKIEISTQKESGTEFKFIIPLA